MGVIPSSKEWIKSTELGFGHRRGGPLGAVDDAVAAYEKFPSLQNAAAIRAALIRWMKFRGADWEDDPRNKRPDLPISTLLDTVMEMRLPIDPEHQALWNDIYNSRRDRLVRMLSSPPRRVTLKAIDAAANVGAALANLVANKGSLQELNAQQRKAGQIGATEAYDVKRELGHVEQAVSGAGGEAVMAQAQIVNLLFGSEVQNLQALAGQVVAKTGTRALLETCQHVASAVPFVCLAVDGAITLYRWAKVVDSAYSQYKVISSADVVADGDVRAAVNALRDLLLRQTAYQTTLASVASGALVINTGLHAAKGVGAALAPAVSGAKAAVEAAAAIGKFALEVREAINLHKILADPANKLTAKAFKKAPLLGAYVIDSCDTSDLLALVCGEFGQPAWMDDVEAMQPALEKIQIQAGAMIRTSPFVITPAMPVRRGAQTWGGTTTRLRNRWYKYRPW